MKLKTRLILYNITIVFLSSLVIFSIFSFLAHNIISDYYNINAVIVDDNTDKIRDILVNSSNYEEINKEFSIYDYSLIVYDKTNLVYGDNNSDVETIINNSDIKSNILETVFINNTTGVIKSSNNKIFIALKNKNENEFINDEKNLKSMINRFIRLSIISIIFLIIVVYLFSKFVVKRIMKPITLLSDGAKRVEYGNYDEKIEYNKDDEFKVLVHSFNDMQKHLKEETIKNEKYEKAKLEMINGISHDIRTPLTAVKGYIKGIQDGVAKTKDKQKEYLNIAYNRTLDIEKLINNLFDTFNYETGEIKLNFERIEIEEYINNYINRKKEELKDKNIKIKTNKLPVKVYTSLDVNQFDRVFDNLINNSIKYANIKNLIIDINTWTENGKLKISFKDNGIGVKEDNLNKLFDEFYKEDNARSENGSGLGLFIVKTIVELHNGNIIAKNKNGLYFEITLGCDRDE